MRAEQTDTKKQILDAAEALFAREGYQGTSMRAITGSAGVNVAAANYHFGSKEALLEAVFERRLKPLNEARLRRLKEIRDEARRTGRRPDIRGVLRAFIEPAFELRERGGAEFSALAGRAFTDPDGTVQRIFLRLMRPISQSMMELLALALPEVPKETVFWRYQFVIGALARTTRIYGNPRFEAMRPAPEGDIKLVTGLLIDFAETGMMGKSPEGADA
ncbi:MAG: TetR family transcriptional regulator [Nitrospiraceae bacterium]|nr:TetR family transcriptional regulator [Nitrospiraceae bacterium]